MDVYQSPGTEADDCEELAIVKTYEKGMLRGRKATERGKSYGSITGTQEERPKSSKTGTVGRRLKGERSPEKRREGSSEKVDRAEVERWSPGALEDEVCERGGATVTQQIASASDKFPESVILEITKMVSINLFRTLSSPPRQNMILEKVDADEEEPKMDPAWPHFQIIYEFFLRSVASLMFSISLILKIQKRGST
ncbi:uncharacterized protein LOC121986796 [Zingiber officinale]|uniref:uncharacterized protein LOC121986796 n=1 Tax=Zingiber officinale TaxID=94328 RepID=UPI001C4C64A1|nr:uncharacterized protein LOC121986796 [Zingiber officinale]